MYKYTYIYRYIDMSSRTKIASADLKGPYSISKGWLRRPPQRFPQACSDGSPKQVSESSSRFKMSQSYPNFPKHLQSMSCVPLKMNLNASLNRL